MARRAVCQRVSRRRMDTSRLLAQDVARAAHGVDQARLPGRLQLLPQVADVDLDDLRLALEVVAPDPLIDAVAGEDLPRVLQEEAQQLVLGRRQGDGAAAACRLAG